MSCRPGAGAARPQRTGNRPRPSRPRRRWSTSTSCGWQQRQQKRLSVCGHLAVLCAPMCSSPSVSGDARALPHAGADPSVPGRPGVVLSLIAVVLDHPGGVRQRREVEGGGRRRRAGRRLVPLVHLIGVQRPRVLVVARVPPASVLRVGVRDCGGGTRGQLATCLGGELGRGCAEPEAGAQRARTKRSWVLVVKSPACGCAVGSSQSAD